MSTVSVKRSYVNVLIDGSLYAGIAAFGAAQAAFAGDEAAKYIAPETLFKVRTICQVGWQTLLAVKLYRSTGFAKHQQDKDTEDSALPPASLPAQVLVSSPVPVLAPTPLVP